MIPAPWARCVHFRKLAGGMLYRDGAENASPEGRAELREPNTRFIGSVAYFPERYGDDLIHVGLEILNRRPVPPAVFLKHQLITRENVDHVYPNDSLLQN